MMRTGGFAPRSQRGQVVVQAYLSRNLGDDLMIQGLAKSNPETQFWCPSLDFGQGLSLSALQNLHPIAWRAAVILILRGKASFLVIGGSMFMGRKGMQFRQHLQTSRMFLRWLSLGIISKLRSQEFSVIGVNIGPMETRWFTLLFKLIFRSAGHVTVRDRTSAEILKKWKVDDFILAPDLVFSLVNDTSAASDAKRVGVSVMLWPGEELSGVAAWYAELIRALLKQESVDQITLFAFQSLVVDDRIVVDAILDKMAEDSRVDHVAYTGDIASFLAEFGMCDAVVGTRFHSLILAIAMGIPVTVICYSRKTVNALQDLGWSQPVFFTHELALNDAIEVADNVVASAPFRPDTTLASRHLSVISSVCEGLTGSSDLGGQRTDRG